MRRIAPSLVVAAVFTAAPALAADPGTEPQATTAQRRGSVLGLDTGTSLTLLLRQRAFFENTERDGGFMASVGAFWLFPANNRFLLGPRISLASFVPLDSGHWFAAAGVQATITPSPPQQHWSPRLTLDLAAALSFMSAPKSFAIEHGLPPALGLLVLAGAGIERRFRGGLWFLEGRATFTRHEHEHRMTDTRTGERTEGTEDLVTLSAGLYFGAAINP